MIRLLKFPLLLTLLNKCKKKKKELQKLAALQQLCAASYLQNLRDVTIICGWQTWNEMSKTMKL